MAASAVTKNSTNIKQTISHELPNGFCLNIRSNELPNGFAKICVILMLS